MGPGGQIWGKQLVGDTVTVQSAGGCISFNRLLANQAHVDSSGRTAAMDVLPHITIETLFAKDAHINSGARLHCIECTDIGQSCMLFMAGFRHERQSALRASDWPEPVG